PLLGRQRRPRLGRLGHETFAVTAAAGQLRRGAGAGVPFGELAVGRRVGRQLLGSRRGLGRREPGGIRTRTVDRFRVLRGPFRHDSLLRGRHPEGIPLPVSAFQAANISGGATPHMVINYGYDNADNKTSVSDNFNGTASYTFDPANRLTQATELIGGALRAKSVLGYDNGNRLTAVTDSTGGTATI